MNFYSPRLGRMSLDEMVSQINEFVSENPNEIYSIVIGTDSRANMSTEKTKCQFVTAVIIHRKGHGARFFWSKRSYKIVPTLRSKIYQETMISLDFAREFIPLMQNRLNGAKYDFEIHIDVGNVGPTREMIKEVVGMVIGYGFKARTKPDSWGASNVADRYT